METNLHHATYEEVPVNEIRIPKTHRAIDPARVAAMAQSILEMGLLEPVGLTSDRVLIYGAHRVAAYRQMGRATIPAMIHNLDTLRLNLAEIDENIQRQNLTALEEAQAQARRKEIFEALHPQSVPVTKRGGPGRGKKTSDKLSPVSFAKDTATKMGRSGRTVERLAEIGKNLDGEAAKILAGTPIANNKGQLAKLCRLPPQKQREVADKIARRELHNVEGAVEEPRAAGKREVTKGLRGLSGVISALKALGLYSEYEKYLTLIEHALNQQANTASAADGAPGVEINGKCSEKPADELDTKVADEHYSEETVWTG